MHHYYIKAKATKLPYSRQEAIDVGIGAIYPSIALFTRNAEWLKCDGKAILITEFPELFLVIGSRFGGNDTTFNLPDIKGTGHR